jgi:hypothetical protein
MEEDDSNIYKLDPSSSKSDCVIKAIGLKSNDLLPNRRSNPM